MSALSEAVAEELLRKATRKANTRRRAEEREARTAAREEARAAKAAETADEDSLFDLGGDVVARKERRSGEAAELIDAVEAREDTSGEKGAEGDEDALAFVEADGVRLPAEEVETILSRHNIPTTASRAIPVPLRVTRVQFAGIKVLPVTHQDAVGHNPLTDAELAALIGSSVPADAVAEVEALGVEAEADSAENTGCAEDGEAGRSETVPSAAVEFDWMWEPRTGVNGIGSGKNLRGKSTVLNILMWALSGRCANFQPDVKSWIRTVQVDWRVGSEHIRVKFNNLDGHPTGTVDLVEGGDQAIEKTVELGRFDGEEQFEGVMGSVMMSRLRLEEIPVWTVDRPVRHKWPAYAANNEPPGSLCIGRRGWLPQPPNRQPAHDADGIRQEYGGLPGIYAIFIR
jgi:hypothetical protein